VFIEVDTDREDEREREADAFASKHLIPEPAYAAFTTDRKVFSTAVVAAFADEIGIHPGIVVGRLHHDRRIPRSHLNGLRVQYRWAEETKEA
jgi:hypothetical protein